MTAALCAAALVVVTAGAGRVAIHSTRKAAAVRRAGAARGAPGASPEPNELVTLRRPIAHEVSPVRGTTDTRGRIPTLAAPAWLPGALSDSGVDASADTVWTLWVGCLVLAVAVGTIAGSVALAALAAAGIVAVPLVALRASRGRGPARLEAALPQGLESVARALRSGASLRQAVGEAAETTPGTLGQELRRVANEAGHGVALVAALEGLAARRPLPGVRLAVAALCLGAETGGAQAQAVDGVATTIRERLAVAAEARALASQARMSALVIGLAPIGFGVFAASTDPRTAQFLLHTSAGLALLAGGLVLDGLGWLWMQRLCRAPA